MVASGPESVVLSDSSFAMFSLFNGEVIFPVIIPEKVTPEKERGSTMDKSTAKFLSVLRKDVLFWRLSDSRSLFNSARILQSKEIQCEINLLDKCLLHHRESE